MKKALLAIAAVLGMGFAANADEAVLTTTGYDNQTEIGTVKLNDVITLTFAGNGNNNVPKYFSSGTAFRMYAKNTMTATCTEGYEITSIAFTMTTSNNTWQSDLSCNPAGTWSNNTWTGNADKVVIQNGTGTSGHTRFSKVTVTYESVTPPAVERPVFTQEGNIVTITCATEGAEIFYTEAFEGEADEPTAESTKYTAPIELGWPSSFKAIAVKDNEVSSVTTYEATYNFASESFGFLTDAGEMLGAALDRTTFELNFPMHVCAQLGNNLWLKDDEGNYMLVFDYDMAKTEYTNGQVIDGLTAKLTMYNGVLPELTNVTKVGNVIDGQAVAPFIVELGSMYQSMLNWYVKVVGIELSGVSGRNATATQNGESIALYSHNKNFEYPEEGVYNLIAAVSIHGEDLQLTPIEFETAEVVDTPEFTPLGGTINFETTKVEITCATEGAEIYYTVNGNDPDEYEGEYYSAPFSLAGTVDEEVTVKARAYKYGFVPSEIATITYKLTSGVEDVVLGSNEAVEYFNLQGIRVAEPANGIYLRRSGDKVEKVTVK